MSVYIIAEAGVNHNGSIEAAHKLIDAAADAFADAVKFQTFKADNMITKSAEKADYQRENTSKSENQYEMLKRLELDFEHHFELKQHAEERGIDFLSTAFDIESLNFLVSKLGLKTIKISSGELSNHPLLFAHAKTGVDLILSTGMATIDEIELALGVIAFGLTNKDNASIPSKSKFKEAYASNKGKEALSSKVSILHCTSEYPAELDKVNLNAMKTLNNSFGLKTGYSDHTLGVELASMAVAAGAVVLEKHFTLDKTMPGPDHAMSLSPLELSDYVYNARRTQLVMGKFDKSPSEGELVNRKIGRKVIVASTNIKKGEIFSELNIDLKRSKEKGLEPSMYWDVLGKIANQSIEVDTPIFSSSFFKE